MFHLMLPLLVADPATAAPPSGHTPHLANPILPGYFADPSLVQHGERAYLYATLDPWGDRTLGCWESGDFKSWTYRELNWPTKRACTSPTSKGANVWAPSVVRGRDGRFFMYVSVGNEVWVGAAEHPLGPWRDANGGRPLIPENFRPGFHMIDAEAFVDDDGSAYLYWGSGWNWVNGKCWAVKLKPDMVTFDGEVKDVTPTNYFEGPFMVKHGGLYHLTYSQGKCTDETYQVHYATSRSPLGPFTEGSTSPILTSDTANDVRGTGHHAVFTRGGRTYILYHRHSIPFDPKNLVRQVCVDEMKFTADGDVIKIKPTHDGPELVRRDRLSDGLPASVTATASGQRHPHTGPERVLDDNFATLWAAGKGPRESWLRLDLGSVRPFTSQDLLFEYPWKRYRFTLESSTDGQNWTMLADHMEKAATGSPVTIRAEGRARFLRLIFPPISNAAEPALFEWNIR